jgi:predicted DNA-binding protein with PD1-like motif
VTERSRTLVVEARCSRTLIGRVARGQSLQEALSALAREQGLRTAWITAIGAFEHIELTEYNQAEQRYEQAHRFERCELLSLQGNLSLRDGEPFWHLHATLSLRENGQDVTYGGHVGDGVVFALEFRVECFDEVELRRALDEATGLQLWAERSSDAQAEPLPVSQSSLEGVSWAMAAAVSARSERDAVEQTPRRGEWIEHEKFGLCKIEGLPGNGVCIIKLPDATRKKIKLDAMLVLAPREEGGRTIFPVKRRRKDEH